MECGPVERNVLLLMAGWADPDGTDVIQSYDSISKVTDFSKSAVRVAVDFWLTSKILTLVKAGGGRGHAPEYAIDLTKVETLTGKGAVERHHSGDGKVPLETTKGAIKVQKGAVERHPPYFTVFTVTDGAGKSSRSRTLVENSERRESYDGDRLDDFKKRSWPILKDPNSAIEIALDVIVGRIRRGGINVTSEKYLEAALNKFDFEEGQDREDWMSPGEEEQRPDEKSLPFLYKNRYISIHDAHQVTENKSD